MDYCYQPLGAAKKEARLLCLMPAKLRSTQLEGTLLPASLSKIPRYGALSYV
jgi:hypothetical protein